MSILDLLWKIISFFIPILTKKDAEQKNAQDFLYNELYINQLSKAKSANADFFRLFIDNASGETVSIFSKKTPLYQIVQNKKRGKVKLNQLQKNYLITGEGGTGKSTLLFNDFIKSPYIKYRNISLFFSASDMLALSAEDCEKIINCVRLVQPKKLKLYFDAVDEMGSDFDRKRDLLSEFISKLLSSCKNQPIIRVSCRKKFAKEHRIRYCFFPQKSGIRFGEYEVANWQSEELETIALSLLRNRKFNNILHNQNRTKESSVLKREIVAKRGAYFSGSKGFVTTPLLLMLYLYIVVFGNVSTVDSCNTYALFDRFIFTLLRTYSSQQNVNISDKEIKASIADLSSVVFSSYKSGQRLKQETIPNYSFYVCLFKNCRESDDVSFIHARFFEYFVAKKYYSTITEETIQEGTEQSGQLLSVIGALYNNDYADMITSALDTEANNNELAEKYIGLYEKIVFDRSDLYNYNNETLWFFRKEIIFRLGRFNITSGDVLRKAFAFLGKVYKEKEETYYSFMVKRWCAISASLLGFEPIEIDYVKNMLLPQKDNMYDLVNRSETLLYYGDVVPDTDKSTGGKTAYLSFRDEDNGIVPSTAIYKRLNRLKQYNEEKYYNVLLDYKGSKDDPLKKYRFRLFDMASIYTLLRFHFDAINEETKQNIKGIVSKCRIDFCDMSKERKTLLSKLKTALTSDALPEFIDIDKCAETTKPVHCA